jgi:DNA topoisomerase I
MNHNTDAWYQRQVKGKQIIYKDPKGRIVGEKLRHRFEHLVIPPAWKDVRICPDPKEPLQAVGRDSKGRKQYIYSEEWQHKRDETKFHRLVEFAKRLPDIRRIVDRNLRRPLLDKEKVISIAFRLLEETHMRIGNQEYACQNGTYGLTTLKDQHLKVTGQHLRFTFKGKSGKEWDVDIHDKRLAPLLKSCQDLPGQELFRYKGKDGEIHTLTSGDVNDYLRQVAGNDFSAKDFRTWQGTVLALRFFNECQPCKSETERKRTIAKVNKQVAAELLNTPTVCRKYYMHPEITQAYVDGRLCEAVKKAKKNFKAKPFGLSLEEEATLLCIKSF